MSLISMEFLTFVAVAVIGYYLIPKKYQWIWLLAFSYIYYASSGMKYLVFLLYTTVVTYGIARMIYGADQKFAKQKEKYYGVSIASGFWNAGSVEIHEFCNLECQHIVSCRY